MSATGGGAAFVALYLAGAFGRDHDHGGRFGTSGGQRGAGDTSEGTISTTCSSSIRYRDDDGKFWTVSS